MSPYPKAILFDLDDTILDDSLNVQDCWETACDSCRDVWGEVERGDLLDAIERVRNWFWSDPDRHRRGRLELRAARTEIVRLALLDLGVDDPAAPTEERVLRAAREYRDVLFAHANALPILLERSPSTPAGLRPVELLIGILRDAGLPSSRVMGGMNAIAASVRGTVSILAGRPIAPLTADARTAFAEQLPAAEFPNLREAFLSPPPVDADFEFGIRAIARGLVASIEG
jgi:hypothetical protein